jgi:hypothetical protein
MRTVVPIVPLESLIGSGVLDLQKAQLVRKRDQLANYMYLPALNDVFSESCALLYFPVTLSHDILVTHSRVTQLSLAGSKQLCKKLVAFWTGVRAERRTFMPAMD